MSLIRRKLPLIIAAAALAAGVALIIIGLAGIAPGSGGPATPPRASSDPRPVSGLEPWVRDLWHELRSQASPTYSVLVSYSPDRSSAAPLEGQTVSGDIYVFIRKDTKISQLRFFFDDPAATVYAYATGMNSPYDFTGGSASSANAFDTTTIADGQHAIGAEIHLSSGQTLTVSSTFTIVNTAAAPDDSAPPSRLVIETIGVDAPVITLGLDAERTPEVPSVGSDVGWYDFSATPDTGGNVVLAGHVTWDKKGAVFWRLGELKEGDLIRVATERGDELLYEVTSNLLVDPDDPQSLHLIYPTDTELLTLVTCGGTFNVDPGARFGGEYDRRTIVQAKPVG